MHDQSYQSYQLIGYSPGEGPFRKAGGGDVLNVGRESGMFGPGVRHHQGAPPRSVYWKLALKKGTAEGQTWADITGRPSMTVK